MNILDRFVVKKCKPDATKIKSCNGAMHNSASNVQTHCL
jgi:hypothetical protein